METITQYIDNIYKDFYDYLSDDNNLCELKKMNYDLEELPDYSDENIQQYYLLRYAYGYEFEYSTMYDDLFKLYMNINQDISVLSIGCGAGLDARGLYNKHMLGRRNRCLYTGIDIIDWNYRFNHTGIQYYNDDIIEWLEEQERLNINILFFPKSIGEFNTSQLKRIAYLISELNENNDLYIMISLRANDYTIQEDYEKSEVLVKEFDKHDYKFYEGNKPYQNRQFIEQNKGIFCYNGYNKYPDEARDICMNLNEYCATYKTYNENCDECETGRLRRQPILKVGIIKYQLIHLKKEQ